MQARICPSLSACQNRCKQCALVWCLSTSFLHLPREDRKDNPSSIFTREKWELHTTALCESVWICISIIKWVIVCWGRRGVWIALLSAHGGHSMEQESLSWASEQISVSRGAEGDFWHGMCTSPSAPSRTVWFPVLAAKDTGNITAYRTLLGHHGLHSLIILIGINREDNSLFQQE